MDGPEMPKTRHGGAWEEYRERFGRDPLDFSANVNPLGMSPAARAAAIAAVDDAVRYPDPESRALVRAIAAHDHLDAACVEVGNGAADLIRRLAQALAPSRALVLAPTFSEYEDALVQQGCEVCRHVLTRREGFVPGERLLAAVTEGIDAVFVCEPNNPTGLCMGRDLLVALLRRCQEVGATLVVDECFSGFLADPAAASVRDLVEDSPDLVVLSAFTKLYGMAGLRLGYLLCSDSGLLARVRACGQSWPVSCVAQAAGAAALSDEAWVARARFVVAAQRKVLSRDLEELGLEVWPGQANYLMFHSDEPDLYGRLACRGIVIRDCSNYHGLAHGYYRVAVRTAEENHQLVETIGAVLREAPRKGGM